MAKTDEQLRREYLAEPWGKLARRCGLDPVHTESQARMALRYCADQLEEVREQSVQAGILVALSRLGASHVLMSDTLEVQQMISQCKLSYSLALEINHPDFDWQWLSALFDEEVESYAPLEADHYGDLMSRQEWIDCCECGGFIDYDGYGHAVQEREGRYFVNNKLPFSPSRRHALPDSCTHIVWFNR